MKTPALKWPVAVWMLLCNACDPTSQPTQQTVRNIVQSKQPEPALGLDTTDYQKRIRQLANGDKTGRWPAKAPLPLTGAMLPFKRVVAYYGNMFSTNMGVLGALPKEEMMKGLLAECRKWQGTDTTTPVVPALHYVAVTAQGSPGKDGMYRQRMPFSEIDKVIAWAKEIDGIVFLDVQVGHSSVAAELPRLEKYFKMPQVHLGIDAEYSMKGGEVPCSKIGTFDAVDVNVAVDYLQQLVQQEKLTPKILIVHRFTQNMITNYRQIKTTPEVQIVVNMDGFGGKELKLSSYRSYVFREPVQFTGFKLFYKYDKPVMYTPSELMKLTPIPIYIQYQ